MSVGLSVALPTFEAVYRSHPAEPELFTSSVLSAVASVLVEVAPQMSTISCDLPFFPVSKSYIQIENSSTCAGSPVSESTSDNSTSTPVSFWTVMEPKPSKAPFCTFGIRPGV
jgi:hypothetical protein